jgi:subtilisin family serine protease
MMLYSINRLLRPFLSYITSINYCFSHGCRWFCHISQINKNILNNNFYYPPPKKNLLCLNVIKIQDYFAYFILRNREDCIMKQQILNRSIGGMQLILLCILFLFSFSAFAGVPSGEKIKSTKLTTEPASVKGQVLVKFKSANQEQNIRSIFALGVSVEKYYTHVGNIALLTINDETVSVKEMVQRLNQTAGHLIEYAEPNYKVQILGTPNDSRFNDLWGMHNTGQTGGVADADIDAVEAWNIATDASSVVIAIIDTGVDYTHPDLVSNMWVNPGEIAGNGIDDDGNGHIDDVHGVDFANGDSDPMDDNSHGTHVAGTIAGTGNNNQGVTGVAWTAQVMAIKFLDSGGSGSYASAIAAVNYAVDMKINHNINLVLTSNSWGGTAFSQALKDAIDASGAANMLCLAAAGNDNDNTDTSPHYPSAYTSPNIISVAASDHNDQRSSFSNYGATSVDLAAPGSNIWSTIPNNGYDNYNGTSMATPYVSGAAALLWSTLSNPSAADVKNQLMATVDQLSAFSGITVTGGRLNLYNALNHNCDPNQ